MQTVPVLISLMLVGILSLGMAASPSVGIALAKGNFRVDHSSVFGNSTLFEGSTVETARASSELHLNSGVRILLGSDSLCRVFRDRLVLEKGQGQVENAGEYRVEALGLRVYPVSAAHIALRRSGGLRVAALNAPVRVAKADGILIANLNPGVALDLQPQVVGAAVTSQLSGCLRKKDGHFLLTDETSNVTVELLGADLDRDVGNRVSVTGTIDLGVQAAAGASQVLRVISIKVLATGCPAAPAAAAAKGLSPAAKKAIIAGVVVTGAAAGAAVVATRGPKPPMSP